MGPGVALLCLTLTRDANVAVCLLAAALATSSFSQAGFLLNYQVTGKEYYSTASFHWGKTQLDCQNCESYPLALM